MNYMSEKLFVSARDPGTIIEFPYVVIVVGNWCPAWCDLCSFSSKVVKESECFDYDIIKNLIQKIDTFFFWKVWDFISLNKFTESSIY